MSDLAQNPDALTQALAEPSRRAILEAMRYGPKSVTDLVQATGLKQPNVSNHLAKMRAQNIVHAERIGRHVFYGLARPVADFLLRLHEFTTEALAQHVIGESPDIPANSVLAMGTANSSVSACSRRSRSSANAANGNANPIGEWRACLLESLLTGNEDRAQAVVHAMLAARVSLPVIYSDIFEWAMNRVGDLYELGGTDVAHEHLATEMVERLMARVAQFYVPVARCHRRAVLGCVAGNAHALGLRMLADAIRVVGWDTLFLGANVPTDSFASMVNSLASDLVIISCSMQEQVAELKRLVDRLKAARMASAGAGYRIMVGGRCLNARPEIVREISADMTARDIPGFLAGVASTFAEPKPGR